MVHELTQQSWALSDRAMPNYARADTPGHVKRRNS